MKTTIELPDDLFREAKATAARRGSSLKHFFQDALTEKLARESGYTAQESVTYAIRDAPRPWQRIKPLRLSKEESGRINREIEDAFEQIEPEDLD